MPAIYVIVEAIRGWLQDNNTAGQDGSMYADMVRRMQQKTVETKKKAEKAAIVAAAEAEVKPKFLFNMCIILVLIVPGEL